MRAADTNVIVRYLTNDDAAQARRARALIDGREPVWIGLTVLLESAWVLRRAYGFAAADVTAALRTLAGQPTVTVENPAALLRACELCAAGVEFADALHLATSAHCDGFATFDAALVKSARRAGFATIATP